MGSSSSLTLRVATVGDELSVARVHLAAWRTAYRGIIPDSYLDALDEEVRANRYTFEQVAPDDPLTFIALSGDEIAGFVTVGPARGREGDRGEVYALYVAPPLWRSGIGSVLMARAEEHLGREYDEVQLWVIKDNAQGRRFYEASGWRPDGAELTALFDSLEVVEVCYTKSL